MTRVVLLGDSHLARLPSGLGRLGHPVVNAAVAGAGAADLLGQARGAGIGPDDVLVVSIGTSDAGPGHLLPLEQFADALRSFLDEVTPAQLVLVVPPGVDEARLSGDRTNRGVAAYAERAAALFAATGAQVLEAWVLLAPLRERAYAEDGLHLSSEGYDVLLPALCEAVEAAARPVT